MAIFNCSFDQIKEGQTLIIKNSVDNDLILIASVTLGDFDPYYVEYELFTADMVSLGTKGVGCDCECNYSDQVFEFVCDTLEDYDLNPVIEPLGVELS